MLKSWWAYFDMCGIAPSFVLVFVRSTDQRWFLRYMRVVKVLRLVRVIRLFRSMGKLFNAFVASLRPLFWIFVMLTVFCYGCSVFVTTMIGTNTDYDCEEEARDCTPFDRQRYFGSTARSMFTLFQVLTADAWSNVVRPVIEGPQPFLVFFFVCFIFVTTFGLVNMIIAVVCEQFNNATKQARRHWELRDAQREKERVTEALTTLIRGSDEQKGDVTMREIRNALSTTKAAHVLQREEYSAAEVDELLQLNTALMDHLVHMRAHEQAILGRSQASLPEPEDSTHSAHSCHEEQLDADRLDISEFVHIALRLRGPAQSRDTLSIFLLCREILGAVNASNARIQGLEAMVADVRRAQQQMVNSVVHNHCQEDKGDAAPSNGSRGARASRRACKPGAGHVHYQDTTCGAPLVVPCERTTSPADGDQQPATPRARQICRSCQGQRDSAPASSDPGMPADTPTVDCGTPWGKGQWCAPSSWECRPARQEDDGVDAVAKPPSTRGDAKPGVVLAKSGEAEAERRQSVLGPGGPGNEHPAHHRDTTTARRDGGHVVATGTSGDARGQNHNVLADGSDYEEASS
mmetsp:Transcript_22548/g.57513  ORF Transcript_22548/g.57513 Transcript_22548/m.57513 type:complete len:576 (+) Transcript_22548:514-2241(+)